MEGGTTSKRRRYMRLAAATTGLVLAHVLVADGACRHRARALSENTLLFLSFAHFRHTNNKTPTRSQDQPLWRPWSPAQAQWFRHWVSNPFARRVHVASVSVGDKDSSTVSSDWNQLLWWCWYEKWTTCYITLQEKRQQKSCCLTSKYYRYLISTCS